MTDAAICSLISTTKTTVQAIRNKTHARMHELHPKDPVLLGFCSQMDLENAVKAIKPSEAKQQQQEA